MMLLKIGMLKKQGKIERKNLVLMEATPLLQKMVRNSSDEVRRGFWNRVSLQSPRKFDSDQVVVVAVRTQMKAAEAFGQQRRISFGGKIHNRDDVPEGKTADVLETRRPRLQPGVVGVQAAVERLIGSLVAPPLHVHGLSCRSMTRSF